MIRPDLQFTLLCDDLRVENNGKFILIGLFDNIAAAETPVVHKKFVVVNRWGKGQGQFTEQTRILCAETGELAVQSNPVPFRLGSMDHLHNVVSQFRNVRFPRLGKYWVEVLIDGELARSFNFYVRQTPAAPAPPRS